MKIAPSSFAGTGGSKNGLTYQRRGDMYIVREKKGVQKKRAVKVSRYKQRFRTAALSWNNDLSATARSDWQAYADATTYNTGLVPQTKISGLNFYMRQTMWKFAIDNEPQTGQEIFGVTTLIHFVTSYLYCWLEIVSPTNQVLHFHWQFTANVDMDDGSNHGTKYAFFRPNTLGAYTSKAQWWVNGPQSGAPAGTLQDLTLDQGIDPGQFVAGETFVVGFYLWTEGNLSLPQFQPLFINDHSD